MNSRLQKKELIFVPVVSYISEAVQTLKAKPRPELQMTSDRRVTPVKSSNLMPVQSEAFSAYSVADSAGTEISSESENEGLLVGDTSQKKLMCRINRLTVLVAMIMWMVSNTRKANIQLQECTAFIKMVKDKKPKDVTAMDRHCVRTCECELLGYNRIVIV